MFCPTCGHWNRGGAGRCTRCSEKLPALRSNDELPDAEVTRLRQLTGGRYMVSHRIASGGMASVYYALQHPLDRPCVIKVLHPQLARNREMRERFRREAESAAQLIHPHICTILDLGIVGEEIYIVMVYLGRGTLFDRLQRRRYLPPEEVAAVMAQVAGALDFAHQHGIIHRDVKPDNIMFDESDHAIVTDFGIATLQFRTRLTGSGNVMGTPHYMSPEQARGRLLDGRSDLYTLGVVMYETLVGFPPFDGADMYSISYKHVHETPIAPEAVDSRVPSALSEVVMRCLEKSPNDRYQTGAELADELVKVVLSMSSSEPPAHLRSWLARRAAVLSSQ